MPTNLSAAVASSSDEPVIAAGSARVGGPQATWPCLPATSSIINGNIETFIHQHWNSTVSPRTSEELADYLALANCGHLFDGWRYLSQATLALLNGSRGQALHLAYYAELRAALSILAGSGIGIVNKKNFALTQTGDVHWFRGPTHSAAWEALVEWAKKPTQAVKVMSCFEALDLPASSWGEACNVSPSLPDIASKWLQEWSVDINTVGKDQFLRNKASYQPNLSVNGFNQLDESEVKFIYGISSSCNPISNGGLEFVDQMLMLDLCKKACQIRFEDVNQSNMDEVWNDVSSWLQNSGHLTEADSNTLIGNLKNCAQSPASQIFANAAPTVESSVGVISRAFLLLRLASALTRNQWIEVQLRGGTAARSWHTNSLHSFGAWANVWSVGTSPGSFGGLDADRVDAEDDLYNWLQSNRPFIARKMWDEIPKPLIALCRFERVALLAINP